MENQGVWRGGSAVKNLYMVHINSYRYAHILTHLKETNKYLKNNNKTLNLISGDFGSYVINLDYD